MTATPADEQDRLDMARLNAGHHIELDDLMDRHSPRLLHYWLYTIACKRVRFRWRTRPGYSQADGSILRPQLHRLNGSRRAGKVDFH